MRRLLPPLAAAIVPFALAQPAGAALVETSASAGPSAEEYIVYKGEGSERNKVQVHFAKSSVVIVDRGVKRIRIGSDDFGACRYGGSPRRVVCPDYSVYAFLKNGNDSITIAPGDAGTEADQTNPFDYAEDYEDTEGAIVETTYIHGGAGDDRIQGSRFRDYIVPSVGVDKVFARGGADWIDLTPDGSVDYARGQGGGGDALVFNYARRPIAVDLQQGTSVPRGGETDSIGGFERVHGGPDNDTIYGSAFADALYGEAGNDFVDGRAGSDLLTGDSPIVSGGSRNSLVGGDGDDFLDTRTEEPPPPSVFSLLECGLGDDKVIGEADDRLQPGCELVAMRFGAQQQFFYEQPDFDNTMRAYPVAREPDGDPVYAFACPGNSRPNSGCTGTIALESTDSPAQPYGSASFGATPGQTVNVTVELNAAGKAAAAATSPVVVRVTGELGPPGGSGPVTPMNFAWQHILTP